MNALEQRGVSAPAAGQTIDQLFALPDGQARLVDDLITTEQWLQRIGAREILTGIASGDLNDIRRGAQKLQAALAREYERGAAAGRNEKHAVLLAAQRDRELERAERQTLAARVEELKSSAKVFGLCGLAAGAILGACLGLVIG